MPLCRFAPNLYGREVSDEHRGNSLSVLRANRRSIGQRVLEAASGAAADAALTPLLLLLLLHYRSNSAGSAEPTATSAAATATTRSR